MIKNQFEISNIEPFSKFFFKSCYYHALLSSAKSYDINTNFILLYGLNFFGKEFVIKKQSYLTRSDLKKITGIYFKKINSIDKNFIINLLNKKVPLIIGTDCFYLKNKTNLYNKTHVKHFLLLYGYDLDKKTFKIIDNNYLDSYKHEKMTIRFHDLLLAISGFTNLDKNNKSIIEVLKSKSKKEMTIGDAFIMIRKKILINFKNNVFNLKKIARII